MVEFRKRIRKSDEGEIKARQPQTEMDAWRRCSLLGLRGQLPLLHSLKGDPRMTTETLTLDTKEIKSEDVVLQTDTEGDTGTHFIAGLVAAECGVTLTANWLLSSSVTSTQASLGYIGVAVLAWGSISVMHSIPALLASGSETEEGLTTGRKQKDVRADVGRERNTEQGTSVAIGPSEIAQTDTPNMAPVLHAGTSLPTVSFHTTSP